MADACDPKVGGLVDSFVSLTTSFNLPCSPRKPLRGMWGKDTLRSKELKLKREYNLKMQNIILNYLTTMYSTRLCKYLNAT